ncbi:hypothetical protein BV20DRAFT_986733 [Pilatotrama ljubarskyi]|nr:hypothetical protein BV20DRAFT_986733 [Pilatotrama ljubarskyi]
MSFHSSFDASEDRSLLPWLDESSTAPLLEGHADSPDATEDLISLDLLAPLATRSTSAPKASPSTTSPVLPSSPLLSLAPPAPELVSQAPPVPPKTPTDPFAATTYTLSPPPWAPAPPTRDVESELRATVDALLKRKKEAQRGIADENAALREEAAFLRNALRLSGAAAEGSQASDAQQLAAALEQERTQRLRSEEKLHALVEYLAEQVASLSERRSATEKALAATEHDCVMWEKKTASALARCEVLEEANLKVKSLLALFARQVPAAVQQQMQGMLHEVAVECANLKRLEAIERSLEKLGTPKHDVEKSPVFNRARRGTKKAKVYKPVDTASIYWSDKPCS